MWKKYVRNILHATQAKNILYGFRVTVEILISYLDISAHKLWGVLVLCAHFTAVKVKL